jgi:hypothetical protein
MKKKENLETSTKSVLQTQLITMIGKDTSMRLTDEEKEQWLWYEYYAMCKQINEINEINEYEDV